MATTIPHPLNSDPDRLLFAYAPLYLTQPNLNSKPPPTLTTPYQTKPYHNS